MSSNTMVFHGLLDEIMNTEISMVEARSYRKAILTSIILKFNTCTVYCLKTVQFWWSVGQKRNKHNFTNGQTHDSKYQLTYWRNALLKTSDARTNAGKNVRLNTACAPSQWNIKKSVFWLAQMMLRIMTFKLFPLFCWT